jgi:hypothetical protein
MNADGWTVILSGMMAKRSGAHAASRRLASARPALAPECEFIFARTLGVP